MYCLPYPSIPLPDAVVSGSVIFLVLLFHILIVAQPLTLSDEVVFDANNFSFVCVLVRSLFNFGV